MILSLSCDSLRRRSMRGRLTHDQGQFVYSFWLDEAVQDDHRSQTSTGSLTRRRARGTSGQQTEPYSRNHRPSQQNLPESDLTQGSSLRVKAANCGGERKNYPTSPLPDSGGS